MVKTWCLILQVVHVVILLRVLARIRLVPSHFSCLRDDWWEGLSEFALHQGKEGRITGSLARISQISSETTGYESQPECRSGGNKWSYVKSFIILRPGEGLTSNKHTVLTFLVNHKYNEVFRGVYFLTFREISFSYSNLKVCNNTNYVVQSNLPVQLSLSLDFLQAYSAVSTAAQSYPIKRGRKWNMKVWAL